MKVHILMKRVRAFLPLLVVFGTVVLIGAESVAGTSAAKSRKSHAPQITADDMVRPAGSKYNPAESELSDRLAREYAAGKRKRLVLRVASLPDPLRVDPATQAEVSVVRTFKKKYPWVEPRRFTGIQIEEQASESKTLMAIAAKLAPEVMYVNFRQSDTYIRQGFLHPLDEYVDRLSTEELDERVPRQVWKVIEREGPGGEHVWALPIGICCRTLWFRRDLFRDAGLDPDKAPDNWDELTRYARILTDPALGRYGIGLYLNQAEGAWDWITYLWSAGGRAMKQVLLVELEIEKKKTRVPVDAEGEETPATVKVDKETDAQITLRMVRFDQMTVEIDGRSTEFDVDLKGDRMRVELQIDGKTREVTFQVVRSSLVELGIDGRMTLLDADREGKMKFSKVEVDGREKQVGVRLLHSPLLEIAADGQKKRVVLRPPNEQAEVSMSVGGRARRIGLRTPDGQKDWRAAFDGHDAAVSMLYYTELITRKWKDAAGTEQKGYCYQGDYSIMGRMWTDGKIGMKVQYLNPDTITGSIDPDVLAIAPVPMGPTGARGAELNCRMLGIFSEITPHDGYTVEEIREAAWLWLHFWDSDEARRIRTKALVEAGLGKTVNPLYLKKYGYEEYLKQVPKALLEVYETVLKYGRPEPYGKNCQMVYNFMTEPLNDVLELQKRGNLGKTPEEKLDNIKRILSQYTTKTNEMMLGVIPPGERRKRNAIAFVVAILVVILFIIAVRRVWKIFTPEEAIEKGAWRFGRYKWAYIILIPAVASILLWRYVPMGIGTGMVLQDYRVVGESKFTGLQNFADVLWDPDWWGSVLRTAWYMILMFSLGFWTPIALAILLHEVSHCKILYRTIYYLPAVLTGFVVIYLWKLLFDPSDAGVLNQILNAVGLPSSEWIRNNRIAMVCCVLPTVWAGMGPGCLIYLAALKAVPDDLYEAAAIDGCGFWGKIRYITLPTLKAIIIIQFIALFIASAQSSGWILVMSGMRKATKVAGLHIFEKAYMYLNFGAAVTMAWIFGAFLLIFTTQQLKILSRMEFKAVGSK